MQEYTSDGIADKAMEFYSQGLSVFPVGEDKIPAMKWAPFIQEARNPGDLAWKGRGIGVAAGPVSDLLVIDFDAADRPELFREWSERCLATVPEFDLAPVIRTPSGGFHVYLRTPEDGHKNEKLAMTEDGKGVIFETRGKGGYVVTPGGHPRCHPAGEPYEQVGGTELEAWSECHTFTEDEIETILNAARMHDERPDHGDILDEEAPWASPADRPVSSFKLGRPGDEFETRAEWADLLGEDGWELVRTDQQGVEYWRRPGKAKGWSATVNFGGYGKLRLFSSSMGNLQPDRFYSRFGYLIAARHGGDVLAAVDEIRAGGMGLRSSFDSKALQAVLEAGEWSPIAGDVLSELKQGDKDLKMILRGAYQVTAEATVAKLTAWAVRSGASVGLLASILADRSIDVAGAAESVSATASVVHDDPTLKGKRLQAARDDELASQTPVSTAAKKAAAGEDAIALVQKVFHKDLERVVFHGDGEDGVSLFHYKGSDPIRVSNFQSQPVMRRAHRGAIPPIFIPKFKPKDWEALVDLLASARERGPTVAEEVQEALGDLLAVTVPKKHPSLVDTDEDAKKRGAARAFNQALMSGNPIAVKRGMELYVGFALSWAKESLKGAAPSKGLGTVLRELSIDGSQVWVNRSQFDGEDKKGGRKVYLVRAEDLRLDLSDEDLR